MTEKDLADAAFTTRMQNAAFARAYDVWLFALTQRVAEIDLARRGLRPHRPRRSRVRPRRLTKHTIPNTA